MTSKYNQINNITGWVIFLIATIVYLLTIEPTTSFWDCGEFISSSYKLEVGHPPGAPFFMILARFFTLFSGGDVTIVAKMVNSLSALASSFTILFLFWTITHLAKKIVIKDGDFSSANIIAVIGSGITGALAYTFSDTFWFSAVEGEVYATSSLFTAVVFWAILKWENVAEEKHSNRWIILIAYLMGLSIGVHLLNLLAIPAIVFVYYFKKYNVSKKGIITALLISVVLLGTLMYMIIPGVPKFASFFELFFVNTLHLPYNSGVIFYFILLTGLAVFSIHYTVKKKKVLLNTIIVAFTVMVIGYSSFAMIIIRSLSNPPMDQNNPETVFSLLYYLNREQYGDRPLTHGQYFNAPIVESEDGKPTYTQQDNRYVITSYRPEYIYDQRFTTIFPRMYSSDPQHAETYQEYGNIKGTRITVTNNQGEQQVLVKPTFGENLKFFFTYQLGHMYFRYFMWNFAGRQNDIQGHGSILRGNWMCGIKFIDEARLGSQEKMSESFRSNKAMNKYYLLPLLLGLFGLFFHYNKSQKDFWVIILLFVLTGIAIVVYLNQYPHQPRERDYAFAGSFYAFTVWIGLGVLGLFYLFKRKLPVLISALLSTIVCLFIPGIMAAENWDDHDRSGRYTARDFASNYLNSCAPNAILFTNGDNDTFPLWYAQEVEGIRTDVRVVNLSYLGADWYISQMKNKAYDSDPVPFTLTKEKYIQGTRDAVYIVERLKEYINIKQVMDFVADDDPKTRLRSQGGLEFDYIPTSKLIISADSVDIFKSGTVRPELADKIVPEIRLKLEMEYIVKNDLMVLDLLATNDWKRPVYFAITVPRENYLGLEDYFQIQGLAYRLVPIKSPPTNGIIGSIDSEIMYDNMMNKFKWGNITDPDVYLDENNLRMLSNFRNNFSRLAVQLLSEGKKDSAVAVLDRCMEIMPHERVPYNYFVIPVIEGYFKTGNNDKAKQIAEKLYEIAVDDLDYYFSLGIKYSSQVDYEKRLGMHIMQELIRLTGNFQENEFKQELETKFQELVMLYSSTTGS